MIAVDDGNPKTMATMHPVQIEYKDAKGQKQIFPNMAPIVTVAYHARGGTAEYMPGYGTPVGKGRADIRLVIDNAQNIYIISKSDGMIRSVTGSDCCKVVLGIARSIGENSLEWRCHEQVNLNRSW